MMSNAKGNEDSLHLSNPHYNANNISNNNTTNNSRPDCKGADLLTSLVGSNKTRNNSIESHSISKDVSMISSYSYRDFLSGVASGSNGYDLALLADLVTTDTFSTTNQNNNNTCMDGGDERVVKKEKSKSKRKRNVTTCSTNNNTNNTNNINNTSTSNNKSFKSRTKTKNKDDEETEEENTDDDIFVLLENDLLERLKKCEIIEETKRKRRDRRKAKNVSANASDSKSNEAKDLEKLYDEYVGSFLIDHMAIGYIAFYQLFLKSKSARKFDNKVRKKKENKMNKKARKEAKKNDYLCLLCGDIDTIYTGTLSPWWSVGTANKGGKYRCHRGCHQQCQVQQRKVHQSKHLCLAFKQLIEKYIEWIENAVDHEKQQSDNSSQKQDDDVTPTEY